jgi:UDP-N-acetyl-2-amino-2-deoxyglucuronate dehydrogenase
MKRFAIIGVAGYVAPRHLKAIRDVGGELVAAMDKSDSVGVLDQYFPDAAFFTEFERFERYLAKLKQEGKGIDYFVVCTPNYLHDSHCRFGMRMGADVICEKPLVLNPHNLEGLKMVEEETGRKVFTILQLRLHPELIQLKARIDAAPETFHEVNLKYITPRGKWYQYSWKGDVSKSGGLATNIGIHLFDLLSWLFGNVIDLRKDIDLPQKMSGELQLAKAKVKWLLSTDKADLPEGSSISYRSLVIDGVSLQFDEYFETLHHRAYAEIMSGKGFQVDEMVTSLEICAALR